MTTQPQPSKTNLKPAASVRPYWHVDVKWISGILLFFSLATALFMFNLSKATERDFVVQVTAKILSNFVDSKLDSSKAFAQLKKQAAKTPGKTVTPIKELPMLTIDKADLKNMTASELKTKLFSQFTGPMYDQGVKQAAAGMGLSTKDQESFAKQASFFGVFNEQTHKAVNGMFKTAAFFSVLFLGALVFFSNRWGRAFSPGLVFALVSIPGVILGGILVASSKATEKSNSILPPELLDTLGTSVTKSYSIILVLAVVLIVVSLIGKTVLGIAAKSKK